MLDIILIIYSVTSQRFVLQCFSIFCRQFIRQLGDSHDIVVLICYYIGGWVRIEVIVACLTVLS